MDSCISEDKTLLAPKSLKYEVYGYRYLIPIHIFTKIYILDGLSLFQYF